MFYFIYLQDKPVLCFRLRIVSAFSFTFVLDMYMYLCTERQIYGDILSDSLFVCVCVP